MIESVRENETDRDATLKKSKRMIIYNVYVYVLYVYNFGPILQINIQTLFHIIISKIFSGILID